MFKGFSNEAIDFLVAIQFNNNKEFFEANRALYEREVKNVLADLAEELAPFIFEVDPQLDTRPSRVCSRIRRDTRFSRDKSPYRNYMWLSWRYSGEKRAQSFGLFWDASPTGMSWGCGDYDQNKPVMDVLREHMRTKPEELVKIFTAKEFTDNYTLYGPDYVRIEVPPEVPDVLVPLYIKKGFYISCNAKAEDYALLFSPDLVERIKKEFTILTPLYRYMRAARAEIPGQGDGA